MGRNITAFLIAAFLFFSIDLLAGNIKVRPSITALSAINYNFRQGLEFKKKGELPLALQNFKVALIAVQKNKDIKSQITCLYWLGNTTYAQKNYDESLKWFSIADSLLMTIKNQHDLYLDIKYREVLLCYKKGNCKQAYSVIDDALKHTHSVPAEDSILARIMYRKGMYEYSQDNYLMALESFKIANVKGVSGLGANSIFHADVLNALGVLNYLLARNDEALAFYLQSVSLIKKNKIIYPCDLGTDYCNVALVYKDKKDYTNALLFLNKSLDLFQSDFENGKASIGSIYENIQTIYQEMGRPEKQLENLNKSLYYSNLYSTNVLPKIFVDYASYYTHIKDYKKAEEYYKIMLDSKKVSENSSTFASSLGEYGLFCENILHNHGKAMQLFQQALSHTLKIVGAHHPSTGECYLNIGKSFNVKKDYAKALNYFQKALISTTENYKNESIYDNPEIKQSLEDVTLANILKAKATTFGSMAKLHVSNDEKIRLLKYEFETNKLVLQIIDKIRTCYINEESMLYLSENELQIYQLAIDNAINLYSLTNVSEYLNYAFVFADKEHASSLQIVLKENNITANFKLTDPLYSNECQLKKDLSIYNELIIKEKISTQPDSAKLVRLSQQISDITLSIEGIENQLKKAKPAYYQFRYKNNPGVQISNIQKSLQNNDVLMEYFHTDTSLYVFCLTKKELQCKRISIGTSFDSNIEKVCNFIRQPHAYKSDETIANNYKVAAWELYSLLLKPFETTIRSKNLIIVAYEKLHYIPFDVLLTEQCISEKLTFKQLPYLIKQNSIRYAYAAELINIRSNNSYKGIIAAFAPNYEAEGVKNTYTQTRSGALTSIKRTSDEANTIDDYFPTKIYSANNASEGNFKKEAGNYSSLHLAMHAVIDDENPLNSRLIFTPSSSKSDDDLLYTYEICNLNLNVQMLVLSACNTGYGKLRKGEGMMSLTRSFALAGVPSIVTTLWSVNDNTSANLMGLFYKNLTSKNTKDGALRNAKLQYINDADIIHAHPYYWAGYVLIGNNSPFEVQLQSQLYQWVLFFILLILVVIWFLRRRVFKKLIHGSF